MGLSVNRGEVLEIIKECFTEEGMVEPENFYADFQTLTFETISSFNGIGKLCSMIRGRVFDAAEMEWEYGDIVAMFATPVRFRISQQLGFEDYISADRDNKLSYRAFFRIFLGTLDEGEEWTIGNFKEWEYRGETGMKFYSRLRRVCGWNIETLKAIIGDDAEEVLERNPCVSLFKPQILRSPVIARKYLVCFLNSLPVGAKWNSDTLRLWAGQNGVNGSALYYWMNNNLPSGVTKATLQEFLTEKYVELLTKHEYNAYEIKINSLGDVKKYLLEFCKQLDEGEEWWSRKLSKWQAQDGFNGLNIRFYVVGKTGTFDEASIRYILGEDANEVLERNPFVAHEKRVNSLEDVQKYLVEFLRSLERGRSWSVAMLRAWRSPDNVLGENVYRWITRNIRSFVSEKALIKVLGEKARILLRRNPFERKSDDRFYVRLFFKDFLGSLQNGEKWSVQRLSMWQNTDGVSGRVIYRWIRKNVRHEGKVDWMYVLLNFVPTNMLEKHPFTYRNANFLDDEQHFTTSQPEFEKRNLGRGTVDESAQNPEDLVIEEEERKAMELQFLRLREVTAKLDLKDRLIINSFLNDEDVDQASFLMVIERLKTMLGEE